MTPPEAQPPKSAVRAEPPLPDGPDDEVAKLREARLAFARGDYRGVRRRTSALAASSTPAIADAARELGSRLGVDRAVIALYAACLVVFVWIAWSYLG